MENELQHDSLSKEAARSPISTEFLGGVWSMPPLDGEVDRSSTIDAQCSDIGGVLTGLV